MVDGPLVRLPVVMVLGHVQELNRSLQHMALLNVVAQEQRHKLAALQHVQVENYLKLYQMISRYLINFTSRNIINC